ncbi:hypothetical protein [Rhodobium gokarnense]|uniref:Tetratricopeptide (TPR) repeat protein n=1 Tax=Rhodobium gokarnense TaxID=364296 RepID=A0ABT3H6F0_9HYPH|nr:hypothetical protein [Rhodobium gokarnense]MCW2305973.1 tetratricopeptide (TPR) repeat protein [Rhodobium gokarnense]
MPERYDVAKVFSWIDANYPPSSVSCEPYSHADLVAERVLRAALEDFPDEPEVALRLGERLWQRGARDAALTGYDDWLARRPEDTAVAERKLECLLRLGRLEAAHKAHAELPAEVRSALANAASAERLLIAMIDGGGFDGEDVEFDQLFFLGPLAAGPRSILEASRLLTERHHFAALANAKRFVESCGARLLYVSLDNLFDVRNRTDVEDGLLAAAFWEKMHKRVEWLKSMPPHLPLVYDDVPEFDEDYVDQIFTGPTHILHATRVVLPNYDSRYVSVVGNRRRTVGAPAGARRRVLVCGGSDVYGFGSDDARTVPSFLQALLNESGGEPRAVENHGLRGNPLLVCLNNLYQTRVEEGDVVVLFGYPRLFEVPAELEDLEALHVDFSRPHELGEVFFDHSHVGPKGNRIVAEKIHAMIEAGEARHAKASGDTITAHPSIDFVKYLIYRNAADVVECGALKDYVEYVRDVSAGRAGKIGSVAVNCNPMTLGHLHLIEYAASKVDHLYLFVIEEDLSFFPFEDRLRLVTEGTAHLKNVTVLKGGRYICTELTFPEYFSKDDVSEVRADASMEAWFFAEYIAPPMGISVIFLGYEPTCNITRQYNEKMAELLPEYGIKVDIIPRISKEGTVISASTVRRLLKAGDFDGIARIVPPPTHRYLVERYGEKVA